MKKGEENKKRKRRRRWSLISWRPIFKDNKKSTEIVKYNNTTKTRTCHCITQHCFCHQRNKGNEIDISRKFNCYYIVVLTDLKIHIVSGWNTFLGSSLHKQINRHWNSSSKPLFQAWHMRSLNIEDLISTFVVFSAFERATLKSHIYVSKLSVWNIFLDMTLGWL